MGKKRILMVMSSTDQFHTSLLGDDELYNYSFVKYHGMFGDGDVSEYLKEHSREFDAVIMYGITPYDQARKEVDESFNGPKILIMEGKREITGNYIQVPIIGLRPNKLEEIVKQL